jgi:hypothetical protein
MNPMNHTDQAAAIKAGKHFGIHRWPRLRHAALRLALAESEVIPERRDTAKIGRKLRRIRVAEALGFYTQRPDLWRHGEMPCRRRTWQAGAATAISRGRGHFPARGRGRSFPLPRAPSSLGMVLRSCRSKNRHELESRASRGLGILPRCPLFNSKHASSSPGRCFSS